MVDLADRVEGDERGDVEVACEEEYELGVCAEGIEEVEGLLFLLSRLRCWGDAGEWDGVGFWGGEGEGEVLEPSGQL